MIGALLSLRFVGKKSWKQAFMFWIVYLIAGAIIGTIIPYGLVISAAVFILLAHYWYKIDWFNSLKLFAVAVVIDIVIVFIMLAIFGVAFLTGIFPGIEEIASIVG